MNRFSKESIDKNTPVPMYYQLKKIILDMIREGKLKPGDMIPTELELSDIFGISRTTTRQAIMELVMEGQLYRIKSKGTFIAEKRVIQDFSNVIRGSHNLLHAQNVKSTTKVLELAVMKADDLICKMLQIKEDEDVYLLRRICYMNDEPNVLSDVYLPSCCSDIVNKDMNKTGLYQFLDMQDETAPYKAVRELESVSAGNGVSKMLEIKEGAPVQLTTSVIYTKEGRPVAYSIERYRGDRNVFRCEVNL